jgi:hypothetical protein
MSTVIFELTAGHEKDEGILSTDSESKSPNRRDSSLRIKPPMVTIVRVDDVFQMMPTLNHSLLGDGMAKPRRKLTAAQRRARRERKRKYMTIFINGRQKSVPRPQLIDGLPVDEFIARNADPIWLHENEMWELL